MATTETKRVKNVSGQTLTLAGVGLVQPEQTIEVATDFRTAGFEDVHEKPTKAEPKKDAEKDTKTD